MLGEGKVKTLRSIKTDLESRKLKWRESIKVSIWAEIW